MLGDTEHATSNTSVQDAFFSTSRPVIIPNFFLNEKRSRSCGVLHGCEKPGSEAMLFSEKQSAVCGSDQSSRSQIFATGDEERHAPQYIGWRKSFIVHLPLDDKKEFNHRDKRQVIWLDAGQLFCPRFDETSKTVHRFS